MSRWRLALESLKHYRWLNVAVLAGVVLTSAILSGALAVGDSVRESLRQNGQARISRAVYAVTGGDRFFTEELVKRMEKNATILQTNGTVSTPDQKQRANGVQVLGVSDGFWDLATGKVDLLREKEIAINEALARRMNLKVGDRIIARMEAPGFLSRDAPMSGATNEPVALNGQVTRILTSAQFGRYNLNTEQVPVPSIFFPLKTLQDKLEKPGRVNVMLVADGWDDAKALNQDMNQFWHLDDASLSVRKVQGDAKWALETDRVFLDRNLVREVKLEFPEASGALTYLVNQIKSGDKMTPYSMVAAVQDRGVLPEEFKDNEIIITDWLAEDQGLAKGAKVDLTYFTMADGRQLTEKTSSFTVRDIIKLAPPLVTAEWTPNFPGISNAENNADWEPGMPFHKEWIRKKDEDYWDAHKATPKAFVSLAAGQAMWGNRFGELTSLQFPAASFASEDVFQTRLKTRLKATDIGLSVRDLRAELQQAVANSYDLGGLFAGLSFFLIVAALVLTALVFVFGVEQRRNQVGLMLAIGMQRGQIRGLFLMEAAVLSLIGATLGLIFGMIYTQLALWGLTGAWKDAAGSMEFVYSVTPMSLAMAWGLTVVLALGSVWMATRSIASVAPSQLISGVDPMGSVTQRAPIWKSASLWIAVLSFVGVIAMFAGQESVGASMAKSISAAMARQLVFFMAGFFLVTGGAALCFFFLNQVERRARLIDSVGSLGVTNAVRRKWRSISVVALMASGVFMVTAINSLRLEGQKNAGARTSGTGGFDYLGQSTLPIYENLNSDAGRETFGIKTKAGSPDDFRLVQFRMSEGDDASCLNLNRAQAPRLLGVNPEELAKRNAFYFQQQAVSPNAAATGWNLLDEKLPQKGISMPNGEIDTEDVIPGIVDFNTAQYALKASLGKFKGVSPDNAYITYQSPSGTNFHVLIVGFIDNSVLQGSVVISEANFIRYFPDQGGYRFFLMDGMHADADSKFDSSAILAQEAERLTAQLSERGLELVPAWQRLNEFNAVQNTYLSIFSALGGLGLLLGTAGLGVVVSRNILERRGQMGLLEAVGFTKEKLGQLVVSEHWFLHVYGVVLGLASGIIAVAPTLSARSTGLPTGLLVGLNAAILLGGLVFCWLAARWMLRARLIESLRNE